MRTHEESSHDSKYSERAPILPIHRRRCAIWAHIAILNIQASTIGSWDFRGNEFKLIIGRHGIQLFAPGILEKGKFRLALKKQKDGVHYCILES